MSASAVPTADQIFSLLPPEYYLSDEIFEREREKVFSRQWMYAGHTSEIAAPGDFITCEIAGESLIVVRDGNEDVHAFFNVCRHRGSCICDDARGHKKAFSCPYHAWTYGLDGARSSCITSRAPGWGCRCTTRCGRSLPARCMRTAAVRN